MVSFSVIQLLLQAFHLQGSIERVSKKSSVLIGEGPLSGTWFVRSMLGALRASQNGALGSCQQHEMSLRIGSAAAILRASDELYRESMGVWSNRFEYISGSPSVRFNVRDPHPDNTIILSFSPVSYPPS